MERTLVPLLLGGLLLTNPGPVAAADYDRFATGRWVPVRWTDKDLADAIGTDPAKHVKRLAGGVLEITNDQGRIALQVPVAEARDVIIRAKVKKVRGQNVALDLRRTAQGTYVGWFNGGTWFGITRVAAGQAKDLRHGHSTETLNDFFEMAIAAVGDTITLYANGRQVVQVQDATHAGPGGLTVGGTRGQGLFKDVEFQILDKLAVPPPPAAAEKRPVPEAAAQAKAEKEIRDLYKTEYARTRPEERTALAVKLIKQAHDTRDDPAGRFVLLREARDLAARAGDFTVAWQAVAALAGWYEVTAVEMKVATLEAAGKTISVNLAKAVAEAALDLVDEVLEGDDFAAAARLLTLADAAALKAGAAPLRTLAQARRRTADALKKDAAAIQAARAMLRERPDDAAANLAVGRHLCFYKGQWDEGLPLLAKGSDATLKGLAERDLAAPQEARAQVEAGDGWFDRAAQEPEAARVQLRLRARHWYQLAAPSATGLTKTKADKRLAELNADPALARGAKR